MQHTYNICSKSGGHDNAFDAVTCIEKDWIYFRMVVKSVIWLLGYVVHYLDIKVVVFSTVYRENRNASSTFCIYECGVCISVQ